MTRKFKYIGAKQPLGATSKMFKPVEFLYKGANSCFAFNTDSSNSLSAQSIVGPPTKEQLENPSAGAGKKPFVVPNAYPRDPTSRSQVLIRSNRIILDAQRDNIMMVALRDIKMGTENWRCELDAAMSLISELIKQVAILTSHVHDISHGVHEHIAINQKVQYPTGVGPTGPCLTTYNTEYDRLMKNIKGGFQGALKDRMAAIDEISAQFTKMRRPISEKKLTFPKGKS